LAERFFGKIACAMDSSVSPMRAMSVAAMSRSEVAAGCARTVAGAAAMEGGARPARGGSRSSE
jgi:hypothetical protein